MISTIRKSAFTILFLVCASILTAQQNAVSDKHILKKIKGKKIEWIPDAPSYAKVKMKSTKKWGIYIIDAYRYAGENVIEYDEVVAPKFDSIGWFQKLKPFTVVKNNKKYGILLNPYEIPDAVERANCIYDAVKIKEVEGRFYSLVKNNKKWGLVDWFENVVLVDPSFKTPEEVPLIWIEPWAKDMFVASKKKLNADILIFDQGNGDGVFKARNKTSKKWGMYQSLGTKSLTTLIPAKYDSINFFPFNSKYTIVYNNNKIGIYLSYWSYNKKAKETVPCIYEDYKRYNADGIPKLALKRNGKWGWINWLTGEEQSEFKYETTKDLPYPYFNQDIWMEN